jgi:hypothetical protein
VFFKEIFIGFQSIRIYPIDYIWSKVLRGCLDNVLASPVKIGTLKAWRKISPPAFRQYAGMKTEGGDQKISGVQMFGLDPNGAPGRI